MTWTRFRRWPRPPRRVGPRPVRNQASRCRERWYTIGGLGFHGGPGCVAPARSRWRTETAPRCATRYSVCRADPPLSESMGLRLAPPIAARPRADAATGVPGSASVRSSSLRTRGVPITWTAASTSRRPRWITSRRCRPAAPTITTTCARCASRATPARRARWTAGSGDRKGSEWRPQSTTAT